MNDHEFQDTLRRLLNEIACMEADDLDQSGLPQDLGGIEDVRTFDEADVLTQNAGLVIEMADRTEFQITIIRSR